MNKSRGSVSTAVSKRTAKSRIYIRFIRDGEVDSRAYIYDDGARPASSGRQVSALIEDESVCELLYCDFLS